MTETTKTTGAKRWAAALAILVAASGVAYVAFSDIEQNLVYYWTPQELLDKGAQARDSTIRLGGMVEKGSVHWSSQTLELRFRLAMQGEPGSAAVAVTMKGTPPQMFRENIGAVVEGQYDGEQFTAERLLVKHSNEYRAPTAGQHPREQYKTLIRPEGQQP